MITTEHLAIETYRHDYPVLSLAPFSAAEFEPHLPLSSEFTQYNPIQAHETNQNNATGLFEEDRDDEHYTAWGIYVGRVGLSNFVGTIGLSQARVASVEEPTWTYGVQDIHTGILASEWHGRGIGTIAKLALAHHAFSEQGTHALFAQTSASNIGAHKSLQRAGFAHTTTSEAYTFADGSLTQHWMLADSLLQENMPDLRPTLERGWKQYRSALGNITITNVYTET